jgi:AraC-like DNA-binding protein
MGNGSPTQIYDEGKDLHSVFAQGLAVSRMGGGGESTEIICGYLTCDAQLRDLLLGSLPPLLKVNIRSDPSGLWLENSIRFLVTHASGSGAGGEAVLARLSEALFLETLRRYIALMPSDETGWLAGARDADIGRALALLHRHAARPWTIGSLAEEVGVSRSVLAERFRHYLNEPPMAYLTRWRLQLGARMLKSTSQSVAQIAAQAGYESEAAFNRAFKRHFGIPPARFRRTPGAAAAAT